MRRDFTYVDDIIGGVKAALFRPGLAPYELINLGNHQAENLMDMIRVLSESLGVEPRTEFLPMQPGDVEATYADITQASAKLGFAPKTSIAEGIPKFVAWYRSYYGKES
jgi:UDP-glucuronate 4-epimerase